MTVPDDRGIAPVQLAVVDPGRHVAGARAATPDEYSRHVRRLAFDRIAAVSLDEAGEDILILWAGLGCEKTATLTVNPLMNEVTILPGPITEDCELAQINRGVVLSFGSSRSVSTMQLNLELPEIVEPS